MARRMKKNKPGIDEDGEELQNLDLKHVQVEWLVVLEFGLENRPTLEGEIRAGKTSFKLKGRTPAAKALI